MIVQTIRSLIFYVFFIGITAILAIPMGLYSLVAPKFSGYPVVWFWYRANLLFLRLFVGIKSKIGGEENLPDGPCIIASKHQSDWDIFALLPATGRRPSFIAKKQLLDIPFFGWAARNFQTISVDRKKGRGALPQMIEQSKDAINHDCRIVIYPEGTRKAPLADPNYKWGIVKLYTELNVPVVPVALTSGLYWPRNSLVLWPGTARARYLKPIPPGLDPEEFHAELQRVIEAETDKMIFEDLDKGISLPISDAFQQRIQNRRSA
ncbi:lysophospholipid acyltransferase family protein [Maritalea mediterranea]|uniref:1-acyl-sn-glycerol-3-phosphate acyltransferase n=1 Tax=Maritalea mediterranea TaxID=2909667 RepID=A0ABS9ED84_9HYPH|nr:lysophospholipid acyltransferase family protein [Maritalea mediterranea]MCF4099406.1 1-acyl-sn-glycerol-3-phosphate acyltransferase [Maritalea mediterranea]